MSDLLAPDEAAQAALEQMLNDPNDWVKNYVDAWPQNYYSTARTLKAIGLNARRFDARRKHDPVFATLLEQLHEDARDTIRTELVRRALEPSERPVYHKGELVDTILEYDNRHLEWLAERLMPEEYHLPLRVELVRPQDADFNFRMGETDEPLQLPPGDITETDDTPAA